jgi:ATP-binding cassette subfamily C protein CydCD
VLTASILPPMKINRRLLDETRYARIGIILSIILGLIGGIFSVFQAREISRVINQVFLEGNTLSSVTSIILIILLIIVLRAGFIWAGEISAGTAARKIKQSLRQQVLTHIQALGPAYLRGQSGEPGVQTGELVNLASDGIDSLEIYFSQYLPQIALAALIPFTILIFVFPTDALSGVVLLVTAPLIPIFMYLIGSAAEALTQKQWLGLSRMSAYFLDVLQGLTTLKTLGRSRDQIEVIKKVSEHYRQTTIGVLRVTFLSALVLELVATLGTAVVAVEIGIRLLYGKLAFEQAFFILLLAPEFYLPLRTLGTRFHAGMAGVEAAKRIYAILDLPVAVDVQLHTNAEETEKGIIHPPRIIFKDVGFSYSNNHPALDHVSIEIPSGKMTALIGPSGAGKTTLTWLLLRFLHAQTGEIIVDGKNIGEIPLGEWHENLAWVPQNPYLFDDTVAANIKLTKPKAIQSEIVEAARLAHADEFIQELPFGYETRIAERGVRLSAGQAQRIAVARAFLKDAPLLILDEATSHLDPKTDAQLKDSLQSLIQNRTVLLIAHRGVTIARADQVIMLRNGKVDYSGDYLSTPEYSDVQDRMPILRIDDRPEQTSSKIEPQYELIKPAVKQSSLLRMFNLLIPFWGRIALSIFLGFATIASGIGLMATAAYIISAAALHPSIADLQVAIVGVRFYGISRGVFRYLERLVSHDVTFRLLARWRVWFYRALEPLAPARLLRIHSGDLLARVMRDIGSLENFYVRTVNPPLVALLVSSAVILFIAGFGAPLAWGLLVFLLLAGICLPIVVTILSRRLGPRIINARAQFSVMLIDSIQGMPDLMTCGQSTSTLERANLAGTQLAKLQNQMSGITSLQTALGGLLANLGMLSVMVIAIQMVSQGQLEGVLLGVVTLTALTCFEAMQPLPQVAQTYETNKAAAGRLYELVDAAAHVIDPSEPLNPPADFDLVVQNLFFQYPSWSDTDIPSNDSLFRLKDISFSLPKGKHIALIGANGAGKTTLVNLLLRFWEYQQGSILLGGHELRGYNQDEIRRYIAVVSQNTYLFSATIKDNLLIAKPSAIEDELIQVAKQAQLYDFIQSLPNGYDTWIGEHGLYLSAGERQRLAVARALLKGASLLILDEPTANLDPVTALDLLKSIRGISQGRSTITITQDMVGLETMDEIIVLQDGSIIERGTHEQLISHRGIYRRMWDIYHQIV